MVKGHTRALLTLVERNTRYTINIHLTDKQVDLLADAAITAMRGLKELFKRITLDNGLEFTEQNRFAQALEVNVDFCSSLFIMGAKKKRK
ncbi:hypothetical protein [Reinekea sp. G2M2-21]|uniref:hypothetical protein n=1 Tax=Reinekea sp. G2M2-21 TaxID=2788942 RepID=UPI0018A9B483|nr:hypothetical protein [Reinekea sp. G2M2-21]